jgi:hypothetical protein
MITFSKIKKFYMEFILNDIEAGKSITRAVGRGAVGPG